MQELPRHLNYSPMLSMQEKTSVPSLSQTFGRSQVRDSACHRMHRMYQASKQPNQIGAVWHNHFNDARGRQRLHSTVLPAAQWERDSTTSSGRHATSQVNGKFQYFDFLYYTLKFNLVTKFHRAYVRCSAMRYYMYMNAHFTRMSEAGMQETDARFYTPVHTLTHMDFIDIPDLTAPIDRTIDDFTKLGSGWEQFFNCVICVCRSRRPSTVAKTNARIYEWRTTRLP